MSSKKRRRDISFSFINPVGEGNRIGILLLYKNRDRKPQIGNLLSCRQAVRFKPRGCDTGFRRISEWFLRTPSRPQVTLSPTGNSGIVSAAKTGGQTR